jgi:hypothetical protein
MNRRGVGAQPLPRSVQLRAVAARKNNLLAAPGKQAAHGETDAGSAADN